MAVVDLGRAEGSEAAVGGFEVFAPGGRERRPEDPRGLVAEVPERLGVPELCGRDLVVGIVDRVGPLDDGLGGVWGSSPWVASLAQGPVRTRTSPPGSGGSVLLEGPARSME